MRVLITGVTGFAGRHLTSFAATQPGVVLSGIGRRPLSEADPPAEVERYDPVDLAHAAETDAAIRSAAPDLVFHLAAEASVASSWDDPARVITNNVCSTLNLLDAVRRHTPGARVLVAGSGEEYGEPARLPVTEDHPLSPKNPYAVSKASLDLAAGFYADAYGMRIVRTRAFNHAGPGQSDSYVVSNFARQIVEAEAAGQESVEVLTGNPDVRRDFTDVRDVVRAYWLALEHAEAGVYNICSGGSVSIGEILAGLASHTRLEVKARTDPKRFRRRDVNDIRGSHDKLTAFTDWAPEIPRERTLEDMLEWWRAHARAGALT